MIVIINHILYLFKSLFLITHKFKNLIGNRNIKRGEESFSFNSNSISKRDNKLMKISSNETKPVFRIPKALTNDDNKITEKDDFFGLKRKDRNNILKNNNLSMITDIEKKYKILVICDKHENIKNEIIQCLEGKNIKYLKAELSQEAIEQNLFNLNNQKDIVNKKFLEINFDTEECANQAYSEILNLTIKDDKLNVLLL